MLFKIFAWVIVVGLAIYVCHLIIKGIFLSTRKKEMEFTSSLEKENELLMKQIELLEKRKELKKEEEKK